MSRHTATERPLLHGGRREAMRQAYPAAPQPWIDLSTGINPIPYPVPTLPPDCFTRLPDPEAATRLESIAAAAYRVSDPAMVAAAPGTQILIELLARLLPRPHIAILGPTYAEHQAAWARGGGRVDLIHDLDALPAPSSLVLCNPNNPDGRIIPPARLRALADHLAARGGLLVIDEAFADLAGPATSMAESLPHPAIVILRSFGKTYGLAGIRLGFALADAPRAAAIRTALGPWAVSGPAIAIGTIALADPAWLTATRHRLTRAAATLDRLLTDAGMTLIGGTPLFRLAATASASAWHDRLARAGIMTRRFDDQPAWLRFGLPAGRAAWARLAAALSNDRAPLANHPDQ
ncbi:threonine-phosphate decarboxylase CobD [Acidiphilium sp. PA]|nr:threonine-phosphate decarboxylase CobD [Acidiphilium sp. PA]